MGDEPNHGPIMNQSCWWLTDTLSRMLEPAERDAVLGDISESRESASQALCGVLGLVARRQAILWSAWRPWVTLLGVIIPLAIVLSIVSRSTSDVSAIYIWMYANNWDWPLLSNPGFWRLLAETVLHVALWYLTLSCVSWASGFLLGSISRGMIQINGVLLCLMLLFGALVVAPQYSAFLEAFIQRTVRYPDQQDGNAVVFALSFYRVLLPLIVQAILVALPAVWGLRQGLGTAKLRPLFRTILWTAATATLAAMVIQERGFWLLLGPHFVNALYRPGSLFGWGMRLLQFVVYWPVVYLIASALKRRRHSGIATT
ncbi:MAG TPA: hypothetical protein VFE61_23455 [Candidatus Sulfotelmatobacter sp.]|jgi:hypothetical protein|nr:hypothetical protein [Candidatus Sulfotelmatobacter sp.]